MAALLEVENLSVDLLTSRGMARAVRGVSFALERGQTLGIVGESGCGKSVTALALMRLLPDAAEISGRVALNGAPLLTLSEAQMCAVRGNSLAMIFQEPMTSLNPVHTIGRQIGERSSCIAEFRGARRGRKPWGCWSGSVCRTHASG